MKHFISRAIIVVVFALSCISARAQWKEMAKPAEHLTSIYFIDANLGYGVGTGVFKTVDGGVSWKSTSNGLGRPALGAVFFLDAKTGFIGGAYGYIYKTTDAGGSWTKLQAADLGEFIYAIYFVNKDIGYAIGGTGALQKTTDGGTTWTHLPLEDKTATRSIYFTDAATGYIADYGGNIFKTTDGGNTWISKYKAKTGFLKDIYFTSANSGYVVGKDGMVYRTTDAGETWLEKNIAGKEQLNAICFSNANSGYAVGEHGTICRTFDDGENWFPQQTNSTSYELSDCQFPNADIGYAVGSGWTVLKTENGGDGKSLDTLQSDAVDTKLAKEKYDAEAPLRQQQAAEDAKLRAQHSARYSAIMAYLKGSAEASYGNDAVALAKFDLAIKSRPDFIDALKARQALYLKMNQPDKAQADGALIIGAQAATPPSDREEFDALLKKTSSTVLYHITSKEHLDCYYKDDKGWYELGMKSFTEYSNMTPSSRLMRESQTKEMLAAAVAAFTKAIEANKNVAKYYLKRGAARTQQMDFSNAEADFFNAKYLDKRLADDCYQAGFFTCPKCLGAKSFATGEKEKVSSVAVEAGTNGVDANGHMYYRATQIRETRTGGRKACERCNGQGRVRR